MEFNQAQKDLIDAAFVESFGVSDIDDTAYRYEHQTSEIRLFDEDDNAYYLVNSAFNETHAKLVILRMEHAVEDDFEEAYLKSELNDLEDNLFTFIDALMEIAEMKRSENVALDDGSTKWYIPTLMENLNDEECESEAAWDSKGIYKTDVYGDIETTPTYRLLYGVWNDEGEFEEKI